MSVAAYQHYHDDDDDGGGGRRFLAEDEDTFATDASSSSSSNLPIWLLCGGGLSWLGWFTFIIVTFPKNGAHKAYVKNEDGSSLWQWIPKGINVPSRAILITLFDLFFRYPTESQSQ
jgi:hypothetical protein